MSVNTADIKVQLSGRLLALHVPKALQSITFRHCSTGYSMELEEKNPLERPHYLNCVYAMETVYDAYYKGMCHWRRHENIY